MRTSVMNYEEANEMVNDFIADAKENGMNVYVEDNAADCCHFPCPRALGSWSGETSALYVYDADTNEEVYAVAYWEA